MRAAQDRKRPVVNARKARCQNFESNFIVSGELGAGAVDRTRRCRAAGACGSAHGEDDRTPVGETYWRDHTLSAAG
jgi:hypothetical protein